MTEISAEDMAEAFRRWEDFAGVQSADIVEDLHQREEAGEDVGLIWGELRERMEQPGDPESERLGKALRVFREAVGLSDDVMAIFWRELISTLDPSPGATEEEKIDSAGFTGLAIGLLAHQFAEEREGTPG